MARSLPEKVDWHGRVLAVEALLCQQVFAAGKNHAGNDVGSGGDLSRGRGISRGCTGAHCPSVHEVTRFHEVSSVGMNRQGRTLFMLRVVPVRVETTITGLSEELFGSSLSRKPHTNVFNRSGCAGQGSWASQVCDKRY